MRVRNVFRQARLDRIVELVIRGATWQEVARDVGLTARQVRRIRKTGAFRATYEHLRSVYDPAGSDFVPRRVQQLEAQREAGMRGFYEALGVSVGEGPGCSQDARDTLL